ncbi:MAG: hypothetical protein AAF211_08225 [Myxococcota bacterium]
MRSMRTLIAGSVALGTALVVSMAHGGSVELPHTFQADTPAVADEVNANFEALEVAVDDNDARLTALESPPPARGRVLLSGDALIGTANSGWGRLLVAPFSGTSFTVPQPLDYAGGDVTFRAVWRTLLFNDPGIVELFIRPRSLEPGDGWFDVSGIAEPVIVESGSQFTYFETEITVPADALENSVWLFAVQRGGNSETYGGDIEIGFVTLEYDRD